MDLAREFLIGMWFVSTIPFLLISIKENGSSRGWLARLFVGQDYLLLLSVLFLSSINEAEGTIRIVFGMSFFFKTLMGYHVMRRQYDIQKADLQHYNQFYNKRESA